MRITDVSATWLRYPIDPDRRHTSDFGTLATFDMTLVRVDTDAGIVGYGESKGGVGSAAVNSPLVSLVQDDLRPLILGADPRNLNALWERMYSGVRSQYVFEYGRGFPELGRRGLRIAAMSGVDMALWDILAKSLDVPLYRVLGGKCRDAVPGYASGGWADEEGIGPQLRETMDAAGFSRCKMRVGAMDGDVATSVARVRAARTALGPDVRLMVDAHGTFGPRSARRFCDGVADCHLDWFEEPVSADDSAGMAEVRAATDIPIAAGESLFTRFAFRDLIAARAVDVLQPDPAICGGISEVLRIAGLAAAHGLTLAPHLWGSALLFASGLHLAAAIPQVTTLEYSMGFNPMLRGLCGDPFAVQDEHILVSDEVGLGVTPRQDFIHRYAMGAEQEAASA